MTSYQKSIELSSAMRSLGMFDPQEWGEPVPLESLRPSQGFKIGKLLALLNQKEAHPRGVSTAYITPPPATRDTLTPWIDDWLDSGRTANGDEPLSRTFEKAKTAAIAASEFSMRRVFLFPQGNSLSLSIATYDPEFSEPRPEDFARENLVLFLLSEFRHKLAKCRNETCGKYFLLTRINRLYKRGTLCDSCQRRRSQDSAKASTANERRHLRLALHIEAAKRFSRQIGANADWHEDEAIKTKIAEFLNAKFSDREPFRTAYPNGITGKWVANEKNWNGIRAALKGGK